MLLLQYYVAEILILYRKITCAFIHPKRRIPQGPQKIWAVAPPSYCSCAEYSSSPRSLASPHSNFHSLDKVQDLGNGASRERAGPELTARSLENRRHPRTCPASPLSPPVRHSVPWWESGQTCLDSQHSSLIPGNLPCLSAGNLWSWLKGI